MSKYYFRENLVVRVTNPELVENSHLSERVNYGVRSYMPETANLYVFVKAADMDKIDKTLHELAVDLIYDAKLVVFLIDVDKFPSRYGSTPEAYFTNENDYEYCERFSSYVRNAPLTGEQLKIWFNAQMRYLESAIKSGKIEGYTPTLTYFAIHNDSGEFKLLPPHIEEVPSDWTHITTDGKAECILALESAEAEYMEKQAQLKQQEEEDAYYALDFEVRRQMALEEYEKRAREEAQRNQY